MIFHENRLLADDSHVLSYLIFLEKMAQNLSAAVVTDALMVKSDLSICHVGLMAGKTNFVSRKQQMCTLPEHQRSLISSLFILEEVYLCS